MNKVKCNNLKVNKMKKVNQITTNHFFKKYIKIQISKQK